MQTDYVDVDSDLAEAGFGEPSANDVWEKYHESIDKAKEKATANQQTALYIDLDSGVSRYILS